MSTSLIATQEPALFDEEGGSMLGNADVLSWQCYTDLVQCNFANLRGALRGPSFLYGSRLKVRFLIARYPPSSLKSGLPESLVGSPTLTLAAL